MHLSNDAEKSKNLNSPKVIKVLKIQQNQYLKVLKYLYKKLTKFKPKFNPDSLPKELQIPHQNVLYRKIMNFLTEKHFKIGFSKIIKIMYPKRSS